jgi:hypothetical protein
MLTLQPVCTVWSCALVYLDCPPMNSFMDRGFQFSGMCYHVAGQVVPDILMGYDTFVFKDSRSVKNASFYELEHMWEKGSVFLDCSVLKGFFVCVLNRRLQAFPTVR